MTMRDMTPLADQVRWLDNDRTSLILPGTEARIEPRNLPAEASA